MAAGHDRRQVLSSGAEPDHIADGVDPDIEARRLHPANDQVAPGLILIAQRQARAAAAFDGADPGQFVQGAEQAPVIQTQHDFPNDAKTLPYEQIITPP